MCCPTRTTTVGVLAEEQLEDERTQNGHHQAKAVDEQQRKPSGPWMVVQTYRRRPIRTAQGTSGITKEQQASTGSGGIQGVTVKEIVQSWEKIRPNREELVNVTGSMRKKIQANHKASISAGNRMGSCFNTLADLEDIDTDGGAMNEGKVQAGETTPLHSEGEH